MTNTTKAAKIINRIVRALSPKACFTLAQAMQKKIQNSYNERLICTD